MRILYNILTYIAIFIIRCVALFNKKLSLGLKGRRESFTKLKANISHDDKVLWFHCSSLGEYEQGLPVFENLRVEFPHHKIVLSFFSPSGYEIRKNTPIADVVVYLPFDTAYNAKQFLNIVHPELVVFVKYDIWPNYLKELKSRSIRAILISAYFRKNQIYFKRYGKLMKQALSSFKHIFTQDENSKILLKSLNYSNVSISGDTRFDRVYNQLKIDNTLSFVSEFKQNEMCIVAGSTWPEDETLLVDYINNNLDKNTKIIIAPHNIHAGQILKLKRSIKKPVLLYSEKSQLDLSQFKVLILDTIGLLSKVYSYANMAYIGGAMGTTGLHNTLEAAVFGIPIVIGKNYDHFPEAKALIKNGGMYSISNQSECNKVLDLLLQNENQRQTSGKRNFDFVKENKGAVVQILDYIRK